jgi:hypothetical protein
MLSLFENPINHDGLSSDQVRKKWDQKKFLTRFAFAIVTTIMIIIGLELASPNYSITTTIVERILERSETLKIIIENNWLKNLFIKEFDPQSHLPLYTGSSLKFASFFLIFILVAIHFFINDPLSNSELLRNLVKKSKEHKLPHIFRWMNEIYFYAKHLPSNKLPERCSLCDTNGCGNRLSHGDDRKTSYWNSIFAKLSPSATNLILHSTHKCRYIFFLKYSSWLASVVLIPAYILARIFELSVNGHISTNVELLVYVLCLWAFGLLVGYFNFAHDENTRGVWGQFSENVANLFHQDEFKEAYGVCVCKYNRKSNEFSEREMQQKIVTSGFELQRLVTLLSYLDYVVKQRTIKALNKKIKPGDMDSLRSILTALIEMLFIINQSEIKFRCALFVEDKDLNYLVPLASIPFEGQPFFTLEQSKYLEKKLALDSDCIASRSWQTRRIISASKNDISYFHANQKDYLLSMIAIPLIIDEDIQNQLVENKINVGEIIGVITIDCDNQEYFTSETQESNLVEIMPFVTRVMSEMIYSAANKQEKNNVKS